MFTCKDYDKVWKFIFVQVVSDDIAIKEGLRVLYCKYMYKKPDEVAMPDSA